MDDDGLHALVFDLGSTSFRMGKVDVTPMVDLTTAVGVFDDDTADSGRPDPGVKSDNRINRTRRHYVNTNSLRVPKKGRPIDNFVYPCTHTYRLRSSKLADLQTFLIVHSCELFRYCRRACYPGNVVKESIRISINIKR